VRIVLALGTFALTLYVLAWLENREKRQ